VSKANHDGEKTAPETLFHLFITARLVLSRELCRLPMDLIVDNLFSHPRPQSSAEQTGPNNERLHHDPLREGDFFTTVVSR
jgi:hypothetical protein